jgi:DNA repair photolyase
VTRDLDLLREAAGLGILRVAMSVTTLDHRLSRAMEPRCSAPHARFRAMEALAASGVPVMAMTAPMIPALNDHEMEALLERARDAGATSAGYVALRLPREVAPLFREWLEEHYPGRAARILGHIRTMHGGKDYDADWGTRMTGTGPYAQLLAMRFDTAIRRLGLTKGRMGQRPDLFRRPPRAGDQLDLFGAG